MKLEPGSVVLTPDEVALLRAYIKRWETVGVEAMDVLPNLAHEIRVMLTQASDDERKPVVR